MLVRRSQCASISTTIMLNIRDFCIFWVLTKPRITNFACDVSSSSERTTICWHWIMFDYCPQSAAGLANLVYKENHMVDLEIIRTEVGQTFPICFTMLNIQNVCIFWVLTKPDVFQTLPICLNMRHNVQFSLQFPISWILPHNTRCFAEASILCCVFFHILNFSYNQRPYILEIYQAYES